jgi:hypothetical protein
MKHDVRIDVGDQFAHVTPAMADCLAPLLSYHGQKFDLGGPLGYQRSSGRVRLYGFTAGGRLWTPAGFVPRIASTLQANGHTVLVTDHRIRNPRLRANAALLASVGPEERAFLEAVDRAPLGQVAVRTPQDVARLTALLQQFYPEARIAVAATTRHAVGQTRRQLARQLSLVDRPTASGSAPFVGTYWALGDFNRLDLDILLLADGLDLSRRKPAWCVAWPRDVRRYAFLRPDTQLGQRTRLVLEAWCGPLIYRAPAAKGPQARVRVVTAHAPPVAVPRGLSGLARKRAAWHNPARNDMVTELARAFAAGDHASVWRYGLFLRDGDRYWFDAYAGQRRVAVMVEGTEHAQELQQRLPGWGVVHAIPSADALDGAPVGPDRNNSAADKPHTIITSLAAARNGMPGDVVVVGSGQVPQQLAEPWPPAPEPGREVLLVDLLDDADEDAREATRTRLRDYRARGWQVTCPAGWSGRA